MVSVIGSSPHTWRTLSDYQTKAGDVRIISTYVENTGDFLAENGKKEDHLHIRGEHRSLFMKRKLVTGSSPHTWRTLEDKYGTGFGSRIISTYVENTIPCGYVAYRL